MAGNGTPTLSAKEARFVHALSTTSSIRAACAECGIGERTGRRWLAERPAVEAAWRAEARRAAGDVLVLVGLGARLAVERMIDLLTDPATSVTDQLRAARVVTLMFTAVAADAAGHEDRLRDLEQAARPLHSVA